jgi:hypothetical protein
MSTSPRPQTTVAFQVQAAISFGIPLWVMIVSIGICMTRDGFAPFSRSACSTSLPRRLRWPRSSVTVRKKPSSSAGSTRPGWTSCWPNKTSSGSSRIELEQLAAFRAGSSTRHHGLSNVASVPWPVSCGGSSWITLYRVITLCYAALLVIRDDRSYCAGLRVAVTVSAPARRAGSG